MAELVRETYAGAIFDIAGELGKEDDFFKELTELGQIFKENPDFMRILKSPVFSKEEKKRLLSEIFSGKISEYLMNFLKVLVDKNRIGIFQGIIDAYKGILNKKRNIEEVTAVTAIPMSEQMKSDLTNKLKNLTGKNIILDNRIDESILGGVLLKIKNEQMDGTIKSRLESIKNDLSSIIAK